MRSHIDPSGEPWIPEVKELLQPIYDDATPKPTVSDVWKLQRARQLFATEVSGPPEMPHDLPADILALFHSG